MGNYTPLKTKKGKTSFFLLANVVLLFVIVVVMGFYLKDKLITTNQKAEVRPGNCPRRTGKCIGLSPGQKENAWYFFCPKMTKDDDYGRGCQENGKFLENVNEVCFKHDCGTEQIDFESCFESRVGDEECENEKKPTNTPVPTKKPTSTPKPTRTPTEIPTSTPTLTPIPTSTTTPTATPTNLPTLTSTPTSTVTPVVNLPSSGENEPLVFVIPLGIIILGLLL